MNRRCLGALAAVVALAAAGCGSSSSGSPSVSVGAAKFYTLGSFQPSGPVQPGKPVTISFKVIQPSGQPLVHYRTGPGPHVGVHLIIVRKDLSANIIHRHPPIGPGGEVRQTVVFPTAGPYHMVVDIYPAHQGPGYVNFQLTHSISVAGAYHPQKIPPFSSKVNVGAVHFVLHGPEPKLRVAQAAVLEVTVTNHGRPVHFVPWYGALAHAIFFHKGDLAYFHTHICSPHAAGCTSIVGPTVTTGTPGLLRVGVLLPEAGTWRLFLQCLVNRRVVTGPFTLTVRG